MIRRIGFIGFSLGAAAVIGFGCSEDDPGALEPPPGGVDAGHDAPSFGDTGTKQDSGCAGPVCSGDLHQVLDCAGNVITTCPDDQACSPEGTCVAACDAMTAHKRSSGCDYFVVDPYVMDILPGDEGACFAAVVANSWSTPVTLSLDYDGTTFPASSYAYAPSGNGKAMTFTPINDGVLAPGQVAVLFLSQSDDTDAKCPASVTTALQVNASVHGTGYGKAFHLRSTGPIAAYDINPYGNGVIGSVVRLASATLLLPTSVWDKNYIGIDAYQHDSLVDGMWDGDTVPWIALVAAEDGTEVTLSPAADFQGNPDGGIPASTKGTPRTFTLQRGQVLQLAQHDELTGTPILANKPIGVWGGASLMRVPVDGKSGGTDGAHQQLPPVKSLGSEYVAVRYRNRYDATEALPEAQETPPWRVVGAVDGTKLTYDPYRPEGAPDTLQSGQWVEFDAGEPFIVKSQDADHPFYMASYMTSCTKFAVDYGECRGDPEFVNVIPAKQYMNTYTFLTDPTYPETNLVVVRSRGPNGFAPVTLDCAGDLVDWQPLGEQYEWTRIDLVRHDFQPQVYSGGTCDNGVHVIKSANPFGLTVWGWGSKETGGSYNNDEPGVFTQTVSYAYPAGATVFPITQVEVPPIPR